VHSRRTFVKMNFPRYGLYKRWCVLYNLMPTSLPAGGLFLPIARHWCLRYRNHAGNCCDSICGAYRGLLLNTY
jgi:hypothetical protein